MRGEDGGAHEEGGSEGEVLVNEKIELGLVRAETAVVACEVSLAQLLVLAGALREDEAVADLEYVEAGTRGGFWGCDGEFDFQLGSDSHSSCRRCGVGGHDERLWCGELLEAESAEGKVFVVGDHR